MRFNVLDGGKKQKKTAEKDTHSNHFKLPTIFWKLVSIVLSRVPVTINRTKIVLEVSEQWSWK